jgi:hypothetical protein
MYTAVNGIYEDGVLTLDETPPTIKKSKVVVMFMDEIEGPSDLTKRIPGSLARFGSEQGKQYRLPDDFNEPLADLNDYM